MTETFRPSTEGSTGLPAPPDETDITSSVGDDAGEPLASVEGPVGEGSRAPLRQRLEALLVVVDQPVSSAELARVLDVAEEETIASLQSLRAEYLDSGRGFELRDVAGGWRLYSAEECADDVERLVLGGTQARLTHAALETLAVVAYRQPVSRQSIAAIRGVGVDGVVRTLQTRGLIAESGTGGGGATLYVTTPYFLSRLGLQSLDELPSLAPFLPTAIDDLGDDF